MRALLGGSGKIPWKDFWEHSSGTAYIAASLARLLGEDFQGAEFLGALLHDIGYLALAKCDPDGFWNCVGEAGGRHGFLAETLRERFGVRPPEAGVVLAEVSDLPAELHEVIRWHHTPEEASTESRKSVSLVGLSNELAHLRGLPFFRGASDTEVVITSLPAWVTLCTTHPEIDGWDMARLDFELEREYETSHEFIRGVRPS